MQSFIIATMALASAVAAQTAGYHAINLPGMNENVPACSTYEIVWTPSIDFSGLVTFQLIGGATQQTLVPIGDMFGSVDGATGKFAWDVPCDAGADAIYGLKIHQVSDTSIFQYSMPFHITPFDGDSTTTAVESPTKTPTKTPDETPVETPTSHHGHNTTMTVPTTMLTTTAPCNSTITSHKPTHVFTTSTAVVTADTEPTGAAATTSTIPTAGASRVVSGSFAVLAVAAAFIAL